VLVVRFFTYGISLEGNHSGPAQNIMFDNNVCQLKNVEGTRHIEINLGAKNNAVSKTPLFLIDSKVLYAENKSTPQTYPFLVRTIILRSNSSFLTHIVDSCPWMEKRGQLVIQKGILSRQMEKTQRPQITLANRDVAWVRAFQNL